MVLASRTVRRGRTEMERLLKHPQKKTDCPTGRRTVRLDLQDSPLEPVEGREGSQRSAPVQWIMMMLMVIDR